MTDYDSKDHWRSRYIARLMSRGVTEEMATATFEAATDSHDYESDPGDAADDELSYWTNDEPAP